MNLAPSTVVDRYVIESVLGRGGMAIVYRARHNQLGTVHAIKVLTLPIASIRQRLLQEGRVQAALRHPNIVNVSDVIDVGGSPGLVMELIEGPSLYDLLEREPLTVEQVDSLARGILEGLGEAHRQGLIHRDLKPANILCAVTPRGVVPKITDFGLAKVLGFGSDQPLATASGASMGTPQYMAPEQVRNAKNVDQRADIFAVGCILYEMLSGRRPFDGEDLLEIYTAIAGGQFTPIRDLAPTAPERMIKAIEAAMTVDRDKRVSDCDQLLAMWTGSEGVVAAPKETGPWDGALLARAAAIKPVVEPLPDEPAPAPAAPPAPTAVPVSAAPSRAWLLPLIGGVALLGAALVLVLVAGGLLLAGVTGGEPEPVAMTEEEPEGRRSVMDDPEPEPEPQPEPQPDPEPVVAAAPAEEPREAAPKRTRVQAAAAAAPVATGHLVVNTRPWSDEVKVDGKDPSRTPWKGTVSAGSRTVTMHSSDGREATHQIEVPADGSVVLCWDFDLGGPCAR
jgi:hypothetical protein